MSADMDGGREPSPPQADPTGGADPNPSELAAVDDVPTHPLQGTVEQWNQQCGIGKIAYKRRGPDGIERDERLTVHHSGLMDRANVLEEGCTVYFDVGTTKRKGQVVPAAVNVSGPGAVFSPEKAAEVDDARRRGRSGFSDAENRDRDYDRQPQQTPPPPPQQQQQHQPPQQHMHQQHTPQRDDRWRSGGGRGDVPPPQSHATPAPQTSQQAAPAPAGQVMTGVVSRWFEAKRYGFIQSPEHQHDLFFDAEHTTPFTALFLTNDRVSFKIAPNDRLLQGEEAVQVSLTHAAEPPVHAHHSPHPGAPPRFVPHPREQPQDAPPARYGGGGPPPPPRGGGGGGGGDYPPRRGGGGSGGPRGGSPPRDGYRRDDGHMPPPHQSHHEPHHGQVYRGGGGGSGGGGGYGGGMPPRGGGGGGGGGDYRAGGGDMRDPRDDGYRRDDRRGGGGGGSAGHMQGGGGGYGPRDHAPHQGGGGGGGGGGGMSHQARGPVQGLDYGRSYEGRLSRYFAEKRYGFITCDEAAGGEPLFFHHSRLLPLPDGSQGNIQEGDYVRFNIGRDERNGRTLAVEVQII